MTDIDRKATRAPVPAETKAMIVEFTKTHMADYTLAEIAKMHHISPRTLDYWMAQDPDNELLRQAWVDAKLADANRQLEEVTEFANSGIDRDQVPVGQLRLACAREAQASARFIAERRDKRYSQKTEGNAVAAVQIIIQRDGVDVNQALSGETTP